MILVIRVMCLSVLSILLFSLFVYSNVYSASKQGLVDVLIGFEGRPNESAVKAQGGSVKYNYHPFIQAIAARIPQNAINALAVNAKIAYIEPDAEVHTTGHTSNLLEYQNAWGVDHIEADNVHAKNNLGLGLKICILDTGIDYNHPDLAGRFQLGKDFVNGDNDPMDDNGHGTHVSGTAAAILNNAGVVGAAPESSLYVGKVLNNAGSGSYSDVIAGIKWCTDNNAKIISMSFGGSFHSFALRNAVDAAYNKGLLLVAAGGNSGNCEGTGYDVKYPARYASVMAVAATKQDDTRPCFSSTGKAIEISAPGVDIQSTWLNAGYLFASGTSMSTPHVSGSAALVWLSNESAWASLGYTNGDGSWTNIEVRTVLDKTAQDLGSLGKDTLYGHGLVRPDIAAK